MLLVSEFPRGGREEAGEGRGIPAGQSNPPTRLRNTDLGERVASGIKAVLAPDRQDGAANGCEGEGDAEE